MNAPFAAARASSASDGRLTSTSSGCSGLAARRDDVAHRRQPLGVGAQVDRRRVGVDAEQLARDRQADERRAVDPAVERHRREDPDDGPVAVADPDLRLRGDGAQAEPARGDRAEHDGREALGRGASGSVPRRARALSARARPRSAAWTVMPLVSPRSTSRLRRTDAPPIAYTDAVCCTPSSRADARPRGLRQPAVLAEERLPGLERQEVRPEAVDRREQVGLAGCARCRGRRPSRRCRSRRRPPTAPRAGGACAARRCRRRGRRAAAGGSARASGGLMRESLTISPSRSSTRRGNAAATCGSWVMTTSVVPGRVELAQQRDDARAGARVQRARRLVGEDDRRPRDERAGDRGALALAARELRRAVLEAMAEADALAAPRAHARAAARAGCRRTAARRRRCRAPAGRRAGRTAGRRSPSGARAAPTARRRTPSRRRSRRRRRRRRSGGRACP